MLKAQPVVAAVPPSTESTLKLKPTLGRGFLTARASCPFVAASDPVAAHCLSWLVVGMRRDSRGNGGLLSGDLLDG